HANFGSRVNGFVGRARTHLRAVRSRFEKAWNVCRELSAGAAARRAWRAFHSALSSRVGSSLRPAEGNPEGMPASRSAQRGIDSGPERTRTAGRNPGHLGGRIRTHRVLPG